MWPLQEYRRDSRAGELLRQQDLIRIFAAKPIRQVDQDGLALGGEITQLLQTWPRQTGAAETLVLDQYLPADAIGFLIWFLWVSCERVLEAQPSTGSIFSLDLR